MRVLRTAWRFLSHPALSVAGNLSLLLTVGPFLVAVLTAIAGWALDKPALLTFVGATLAGVISALASLTLQRCIAVKELSTHSAAQDASRLQDQPDLVRDALVQPPMKPQRTISPSSLDRLYTEGHRMLKAANPLSGLTVLYGPPPTEGEIDQWLGRVRQALPKTYRRRFRFGPLKARAGDLGVLRPVTLESEQQRRLRESLVELERIMSDIDEEQSGRV